MTTRQELMSARSHNAAVLPRAFAVVCDRKYLSGLEALLNSIWAYHRSDIPVFVYHRGLRGGQLKKIGRHPAGIRLYAVKELPFSSRCMWAAKQQVFAHCLGRARSVFLLDADVVLTSNVRRVFALAQAGQIVSSSDGPRILFGRQYTAYGPHLPGSRQPYLNSGALCLDVKRHWDLAALWAFTSNYGAYLPGKGPPLRLPGHGDQGLFNALAGLLNKARCYHVLPEGTWCDATQDCTLRITRVFPDGRLQVWNASESARQCLVHSSGPKWWTEEGVDYLCQFGDKLECFEHFAQLACH